MASAILPEFFPLSYVQTLEFSRFASMHVRCGGLVSNFCDRAMRRYVFVWYLKVKGSDIFFCSFPKTKGINRGARVDGSMAFVFNLLLVQYLIPCRCSLCLGPIPSTLILPGNGRSLFLMEGSLISSDRPDQMSPIPCIFSSMVGVVCCCSLHLLMVCWLSHFAIFPFIFGKFGLGLCIVESASKRVAIPF